MPLPADVESLPVYLWEQFRDKPFDPVADFDQILPVMRVANLVFWWLLLFYAFRLGNLYGGIWGGRLGVLLIASEPNMLAHAALATMDIAITASLATFVYHYQTGRDGNWRRRVVIPGLCYGFAMLTKASAMMFVPIAMFAFDQFRQLSAAWSRASGDSLKEWIRLYWNDLAIFPRSFWKILGIGFLSTFVYCGSDWQQERSFIVWSEKLPNDMLRGAMTPIAENLRIFPNAGSALVYQIKHNVRGHGSYLFGDWYPSAVSYYFPAILLVKLTAPVLVMIFLLLAIRPRHFVMPLGCLVLVMLLFSLTFRVQIGIRLILPLVSYILISLAVAIAGCMREWPSARGSAAAVSILIGLLVVAPLTVWPDGIRHVNEFWGGTETGYKHVSDSNYDWGQGLKELAEWRRQHGDPPFKIWYYGKDPSFIRLANEQCPLHTMPIQSPADFYRIVNGHHLAVSTSILYSDPQFTPQSVIVFEILKGMKPAARTSTFFIYDFSEHR
jgi:hypothetical protein